MRRRKRSHKAFLTAAVIAVVFLAGTAFFSLRINKVELVPNECLSAKDFERLVSKPWWLKGTLGVEKLKAVPCVGEVQIKRVFPGKIIISIQQRVGIVKLRPLLLFEASESSHVETESFVADSHGYVFRKSQKDEYLPQISIARPVAAGERFEEITKVDWRQLSEVIKEVTGQDAIVNITKGGDLEIQTNQVTFLLSLNNQTFERLKLIPQLVQVASWGGKLVKRIDYRFDRPVVSY